MYRVVTIAGEYGAGSREIGRRLAEKLGWKLLDKTLIFEIARLAEVHPNLVEKYDEHVDPWFHRLARQGLWYGSFEATGTMVPAEVFDAEKMFELSRRVVTEAAEAGECIIVGRGGQCLLQHRADCFHVFIYAPWEFRVQTVRAAQLTTGNVEEFAKTEDSHRDLYIKQHFGQDRHNVHLYNLTLDGELGAACAVQVISCAVKGARE